MATHAQPTASSPVHRGQLVRQRLLCQDLPEPPANLETAAPPEQDGQTTRERYAAHSEQPECAVCHELMDPIGFALEHYDGVGRWRESDAGGAVDASGEISRSLRTDGYFEGLTGLTDALATSDEVQDCFAEQWTRWAFASGELALDCALRDLDELVDGDSLRGLLAGAVQLDHFTSRLGAATEDDGPAASGVAAADGWDDPDGWLGPSTALGDVDLDQPLAVTWEVTSSWTGGWCADVVVENTGSAPLVWSVVAELGGPLDSWWSSEATPLGPRVRFAGEWWNLDLPAGASTDFGFCAQR
jgi:cellulase/cellobiase CelA1